MSLFECPFCDFVDADNYFLLQHVELVHPENGESPFLITDSASPSAHRSFLPSQSESSTAPEPSSLTISSSYIECPYHCGEMVAAVDLTTHTDFHLAESMEFEEKSLVAPKPKRDVSSLFSTEINKALRPSIYPYVKPKTFKELLFGARAPHRKKQGPRKNVTRLSSSELGPYAWETEMPGWLRRMLEAGAKVTVTNTIGRDGKIVRVESVANETAGLVPVLARLSTMDSSVEHAFYCSPEVLHVCKMHKEGGFCGYRNIQMMISYIREAKATGYEEFPHKIPSILQIQDMIEEAWEMGFNATGKIETGGIRMTRKYIGTPEAQALFNSLDIPCVASAFANHRDMPAHESLLVAVGQYFSSDQIPKERVYASEIEQRVYTTNKPPLYFQHEGHSMTIVGIEVRKSGAMNLVVFDPMFNPSPAIKRLVGSSFLNVEKPETLLRAHRRGVGYLERYRQFELLVYGDEQIG